MSPQQAGQLGQAQELVAIHAARITEARLTLAAAEADMAAFGPVLADANSELAAKREVLKSVMKARLKLRHHGGGIPELQLEIAKQDASLARRRSADLVAAYVRCRDDLDAELQEYDLALGGLEDATASHAAFLVSRAPVPVEIPY